MEASANDSSADRPGRPEKLQRKSATADDALSSTRVFSAALVRAPETVARLEAFEAWTYSRRVIARVGSSSQLESEMPSTRRSSKSTRRAGENGRNGNGKDAIALLRADHRQVEKWFSEFKKAAAASRKEKLARQICSALRVHAKIEEEIFYPAFYAATGDKELHHEAEVEHAGARKLITEIESTGARDDYYDAKVTVLSEMIKHHVKEEEQPGGMFAEARKSEMDLKEVGSQLEARRAQLEGTM